MRWRRDGQVSVALVFSFVDFSGEFPAGLEHLLLLLCQLDFTVLLLEVRRLICLQVETPVGRQSWQLLFASLTRLICKIV